MKKIAIDPSLKTIYSSIRLAYLKMECEAKESNDVFWDDMHNSYIPDVLNKIEGKMWDEISGIKGSRIAYKAFGKNPTRYRVSSESLIRRIKRNDELYHVNSIVDVNNLISIRSGLSVGSYDLDCIKGDIVLKLGQSEEGYIGIGKSYLDMEKMLVLKDEEGAFGSSMSDSLRTMVKDTSTNVLVVIYCFEDEIDLELLLEEASQYFIKYANVKVMDKAIVK